MTKFITVPFGYLLDWLYRFTGNYGMALILFALAVQLVLLPITAKSKKSTMKMSRLQPKIQEIQRKYPNDRQKQNEAMQQLQKEEGASMGCGGCLWSLIPLLILLPLYSVVRQPITYMLHQSTEIAEAIVEIVKTGRPELFTQSNYYYQLIAAAHIPEFTNEILARFPEIDPLVLKGINFTFLGLDLGAVPTFNVFSDAWVWSWPYIGGALLPILSAGQQVLSSKLSQRANNSVITNDKGLQDKETAKNSQANQTGKIMIWMMPLMSLWIGFSVPSALSLYWLIGGISRMVEDLVLTKRYRKVYDAEDAARLEKHMAELALEEEKERLRAEKRAANPDGITENTSKKKLQKQQQQAEEAAKREAAKEYAAKKGAAQPEQEESSALSGVKERPYCKGRAYDPSRYSTESTEE